ncbi:hypothetical protein [Acetobacter persici]|uniref:hypothetical protein n=1 Tax=Acetobacter persici TaxID=1076596 RepID=UPI00201344E3|nr:hypothetical protein [Acetobacter persici]
MKLRTKAFAFCIMSGIATVSIPHAAHAQIITSDLGTQANTNASYLEAVEQYLQQGQQYAMQGEQYAQQIEQYVQQVQNARGLGDVLQMITGTNLNGNLTMDSAISATQNTLSNIDPYGGGFVTQARTQLSRIYSIPSQAISAQSQIYSTFGSGQSGSSSTSDPSSQAYDWSNREANQIVNNEQVISTVNKSNEAAMQTVEDQDAISDNLTDNDTGAATQLLVAQTSVGLHQNYQNMRLQQIIADNQQQERIRQLEIENKNAEQSLARLQQIKNFVNN